MTSSQHQGQLVIIGGAEDREGECKILREFVRCAGGIDAHIVVMTVATESPREVGEDYIRVFERLGIKNVQIIDTFERQDADHSRALEAIQNATGVFFTGGDQARITDILKDTNLHQTLLQKYTEGLVIGGTSAGASMMSSNMIIEGEGQTHPRIEIVKIEEGMSFLPEAVIDQHFSQRGRLGRLLTAVAKHPDLIGLGIDENTAIVVRDHQFEVVGDGSCTVVDLSEISHNNIGELLRDEGLALCGIKLHILPEGYKFDLINRQPLIEEKTPMPAMVTV